MLRAGPMPFKLSISIAFLLAALVQFVAAAHEAHADNIEQGFVFIDGEFLPGPYDVQSVPGGAIINGRNIALVIAPRTPSGTVPMQTDRRSWRARSDTQFISEGEPRVEERRAPFDRRPPFGDRRPPERGFPGQHRPGSPPAQVDSRRVATCLESDGVVVSFTGAAAVLIEPHQTIALMRVLAGSGEVSATLAPLLTQRSEAEREQWRNWLSDYAAPEPLLTRVNLIVANHEQLVAENLADVAATRRLHNLAYPLTVLGMVLGVFALGHLLSSPPKGAPRQPNSPRNLKFRRAAWISLGLVVLLSGLDLTWTLLASQAGQMNELNPLGSRMIEDPLLLTLFKSSATFGSCGLLLVLSKHHKAQWAAWWMCLVLTVLTFRWLVLNSMFVV